MRRYAVAQTVGLQFLRFSHRKGPLLLPGESELPPKRTEQDVLVDTLHRCLSLTLRSIWLCTHATTGGSRGWSEAVPNRQVAVTTGPPGVLMGRLVRPPLKRGDHCYLCLRHPSFSGAKESRMGGVPVC